MVGGLGRGPCLTNIFTLSTVSRIGYIDILTIVTTLTCDESAVIQVYSVAI